MKLRNKKTGEIVIFGEGIVDLNQIGCKNVVEMIEAGWEDYEEPKEYFVIERADKGGLFVKIVHSMAMNPEWIMEDKQIGNYFESEEEAKEAVEKLKAWKRLKDKGFRFTGVAGISNNIYVSFETDSKYRGGHVMYDEYNNKDNNLREYNEDLMLLFGGKDE